MYEVRNGLLGRRTARLLVAFATSLWLAACTTSFPPALETKNADQVAAVLADAYGEVSSSYLERIEPSELAIAGLSDISRLVPGFAVTEAGDLVVLKNGNEEIHRFQRPAEQDVEGWADASAAALIAVQSRLKGLQALPPKQVYEGHIGGFTKLLGADARYWRGRELYDYLSVGLSGYLDFAYKPMPSGVQVIELDHEGRLGAEGLRVGDLITHIDGRRVAGLPEYEILQRLRGPVGSESLFRLRREGKAESINLALTRRKPTQRSYELERIGSIARYEIAVVNVRTALELTKSLGQEQRNATAEGQPLSGVILDLRGASGTRFLADERMINAFLGKGLILQQKGLHPKSMVTTNASWPDHSRNIPLVVLIDGFTDQAAETVAAALQDRRRAILVGGSTTGSGIVYRNVVLHNMGAVSMRWALAYAPSGYGIEGRGVMPHVCTSQREATLDGVLQALRRGEALTAEEDRTRNIDPNNAADLAEHRALCPPLLDTGDLAHEVGLAILSDPKLYARLLKQGEDS